MCQHFWCHWVWKVEGTVTLVIWWTQVFCTYAVNQSEACTSVVQLSRCLLTMTGYWQHRHDLITDHVSTGANAIVSVHSSVRFHSVFWTNWPLTLVFAGDWNWRSQVKVKTRLVWPRSSIEDSFLVHNSVIIKSTLPTHTYSWPHLCYSSHVSGIVRLIAGVCWLIIRVVFTYFHISCSDCACLYVCVRYHLSLLPWIHLSGLLQFCHNYMWCFLMSCYHSSSACTVAILTRSGNIFHCLFFYSGFLFRKEGCANHTVNGSIEWSGRCGELSPLGLSQARPKTSYYIVAVADEWW